MKKLLSILCLPLLIAGCASTQRITPMPDKNYEEASLLEAGLIGCYSKGYLADNTVQSALADLSAQINSWSVDRAKLGISQISARKFMENRITPENCQSFIQYAPRIIANIGSYEVVDNNNALSSAKTSSMTREVLTLKCHVSEVGQTVNCQ